MVVIGWPSWPLMCVVVVVVYVGVSRILVGSSALARGEAGLLVVARLVGGRSGVVVDCGRKFDSVCEKEVVLSFARWMSEWRC